MCQKSTALRSAAVAPREQIESPSGSSGTRSRRSSVGFGTKNNDGKLVWTVDASIEASRKALDVDGRGKHGTDKAIYVGSLDVTLQGKTDIDCSGAFRPTQAGQLR